MPYFERCAAPLLNPALERRAQPAEAAGSCFCGFLPGVRQAGQTGGDTRSSGRGQATVEGMTGRLRLAITLL